MDGRHYWGENGLIKYENFSPDVGVAGGLGACGASGERTRGGALSDDEYTAGGDEYTAGGDEYTTASAYLRKGKQDPMSHRIIEKRRRDRMNGCLAELARLIPPHYLKKGRGRVEKTEIIEMAIRHLHYLQDRVAHHGDGDGDVDCSDGVGVGGDTGCAGGTGEAWRAGYQRSAAEAVRYLVELRGLAPADTLCVQLAAHLQRHADLGPPRTEIGPVARSADGAGAGPGTGAPYRDDDHLQHDHHNYHNDHLHSYKFKNCIERRFSRSQDNETRRVHAHKRRRAASPAGASTSTSASGSAEDAPPASAPDPAPLVPVFALHTTGKYYVPLSAAAVCVPGARGPPPPSPPALHPVTLHVAYHHCRHHTAH